VLTIKVSGIPDKNKLYTPVQLIELDEEKKREKLEQEKEKLQKKQTIEEARKKKEEAKEERQKEKEKKMQQKADEKKSKDMAKLLKEQQRVLKNLDDDDLSDPFSSEQENRPPKPVNKVVMRDRTTTLDYSKLNASGTKKMKCSTK